MKKIMLLFFPNLALAMTTFHCKDNVTLSFPNQMDKDKSIQIKLHSITLQLIIEQIRKNPKKIKPITKQYEKKERFSSNEFSLVLSP